MDSATNLQYCLQLCRVLKNLTRTTSTLCSFPSFPFSPITDYATTNGSRTSNREVMQCLWTDLLLMLLSARPWMSGGGWVASPPAAACAVAIAASPCRGTGTGLASEERRRTGGRASMLVVLAVAEDGFGRKCVRLQEEQAERKETSGGDGQRRDRGRTGGGCPVWLCSTRSQRNGRGQWLSAIISAFSPRPAAY